MWIALAERFFVTMKASEASPPILRVLPSPGSPSFLETTVGYSVQGWSSDRVPQTTSSSSLYKKRPTSFSSMMPYHSGRTVPSKWEDAERWITSPISNTFMSNRRPMSRSGPIGQSKAVFYSNYSPNFQGFQSGKGGYSLTSHRSPISSGLMLEGTSHSQSKNENGVHLSAGVSGFSDSLSESSAEISQDVKLEHYVDGNGEVSKRDMATQMSPTSSYSSSSTGRPASMRTHSAALPSKESNGDNFNKLEKDVQVDKWSTVLRWPKGNGCKQNKRDPPQVVELYKTIVTKTKGASPAPPPPSSPWEVAALAKKYEREETKITAWQNLQKAKSEAAVRKLEMNLERKRSESMDKIINKFKKSEKKSQKMRTMLDEEKARYDHSDKAVKGSARVSPSPVSIHVGSFSCCFTGHGL